MWNITSNDVQRAKDRLQLHRTEIETRYAEENKALDAEFAVIETFERAASEFMLRHSRENGAIASPSMADSDPPSGGGGRVDGGSASEPEATAPADWPGASEPGSLANVGYAAEPAPAGDPSPSGEVGGSLDILKPGSRWRLYRGNRSPDPEGTAADASPTAEASPTAG
jgi:hypothetical protein